MANPNTPFGLQPYQRRGSASYRGNDTLYKIAANTTNAIYVGDPVVKLAASADANGINGVNLVAAGTNHPFTGVVVGFLGKASAATLAPSMYGITPGPMYKPANDSSIWYVLVDDDASSLFVVQSNDSGGAPAATVVGKNANLASGAGSAYTGWSGWMLAANQIATTSTYQVNIVGFLEEADNVPGATNAKLIVRINAYTDGANAAGI